LTEGQEKLAWATPPEILELEFIPAASAAGTLRGFLGSCTLGGFAEECYIKFDRRGWLGCGDFLLLSALDRGGGCDMMEWLTLVNSTLTAGEE
jgi:hypothetical protein